MSRPPWIIQTMKCWCNGPNAKPVTAPIRIYSTFASMIKDLPDTAEMGTWRCHRCRNTHTVTVGALLSTCAGIEQR